MSSPSISVRDMAVGQHADKLQCNAQGNFAASAGCFPCATLWIPRFRLKYLEVFAYTVTVLSNVIRSQAVKGLRTNLACRQQLQCAQQSRSHSLGLESQNLCSATFFKTSWLIYPASAMLSSFLGRPSNRKIGYASYSLVWMRPSSSVKALPDSEEVPTVEKLWEENFPDRSRWRDNRADKRNRRSPNFIHEAPKNVRTVDGWSTLAWVKARLKLSTQGRLESHPGKGTGELKDTALQNSPPKFNFRKRNTLPASASQLTLIVRSDDGSMHMHSASTTNEALAILKNRLQRGISIDSYMFVQALKRCLKERNLSAAKQVHDYIIHRKMDKNQHVASTLLSVYIGCGRMQDARRVFDDLEKKTVVSWTIMIGGYAKNNLAEEALEVFHRMRQGGAQPDDVTYLNVLKACASPLALKWGKEVHAYIKRAGLESDVRVATALVNMYAKCGCITEAKRVFENLTNRNLFTWNVMLRAYTAIGSIEDARLLFDRMEERDVITWNIMIGTYAESGEGMEAYRLLAQMTRAGFRPDAITYMNILNAAASAGALEWLNEVHDHLRKAGLESDLRVGNALVHMYAKSGSLDDARLLFTRMEKRDVITWNIMIGACAESGRGLEAYGLFHEMKWEGVKPNAITYMNILNAAASTGAVDWVKEVHSDVRKDGLQSDLRVWSALVHMYAKSGSIDDARLVFNNMERRDVITWSTMIGGLAHHGLGHEALEVFRNMMADSVKPDGTTFVAVLSACSHAGLVDEGRRLFAAMTQDYGVKPTIVHYTCMVDLLGRAGLLVEANLFIREMPVEPDVATWAALLGACRIHGNVELGELAATTLLELEPQNASAYVLLSNIYAAAGKWENVSSLRKVMQERGVQKEPGRSWIEVDNKIHEFFAGDTSHPEAKAIYADLNKLTERLKMEGYIPDTRLVLQKLDEQDEELALCSHSEKLAIVYGLMRIVPGKSIVVYKNLRVCSDCHTASKLISKVTGREIIARDAIRFHRFKDGVCSCGDFW